MDTNLVNCTQCGHSISQSAKACAYCGAVFSEGEPNRQNDEIIPAEEAPSPEPAPSLQPEKTPVVIEIPETSGSAASADAEPFELDFSDLPTAATAVIEIPESPKVAEPANTGDDVVIELSNRSQAAENKQDLNLELSEIAADDQSRADEAPESVDIPPAVPEPNAELSQKDIAPEAELIDSTDNAPGEIEKQAESKEAPREPSGLLDPDIPEIAGNGPTVSDSLEAEVIEIAEVGAQPSPETVLSDDKAYAEAPTNFMQDTPPADSEDTKPELEAVIKSEDSDEEILLTLTDEIDLPSKDISEGGDETLSMDTAESVAEPSQDASMQEIKSDVKLPVDNFYTNAEAIQKSTETQLPPGILKIERAAHDMADALKKQKAAMAKAKTQKKEDLDHARADAAKRKKVALARYQALKKERKSQANIEVLKKEKAAGTNLDRKDHHRTNDQGLESKTKMVGLLKKYEGQAIGINYDNSAEIKEAEFVEANEEFFSVFVKDKELHYSYPLKTILTVVEGKNGVGGSDPQQKMKFNAVIKVYPIVL